MSGGGMAGGLNRILPDGLRVGDRLRARIEGRERTAEVVTFAGTRHLLTLQVRIEDGSLHRLRMASADALRAREAAA